MGGRAGLGISDPEIGYSKEIFKNHLKKIIKTIQTPGGTERNLIIRKQISEILYSAEEIKLNIKYSSSLSDSSADLPTTSKTRRTSLDESKYKEKSPATHPHESGKYGKATKFVLSDEPNRDFSRTGSSRMVGSAIASHPKFFNYFLQNVVHGSQNFISIQY